MSPFVLKTAVSGNGTSCANFNYAISNFPVFMYERRLNNMSIVYAIFNARKVNFCKKYIVCWWHRFLHLKTIGNFWEVASISMTLRKNRIVQFYSFVPCAKVINKIKWFIYLKNQLNVLLCSQFVAQLLKCRFSCFICFKNSVITNIPEIFMTPYIYLLK